jgi:hypothetical protein
VISLDAGVPIKPVRVIHFVPPLYEPSEEKKLAKRKIESDGSKNEPPPTDGLSEWWGQSKLKDDE